MSGMERFDHLMRCVIQFDRRLDRAERLLQPIPCTGLYSFPFFLLGLFGVGVGAIMCLHDSQRGPCFIGRRLGLLNGKLDLLNKVHDHSPQ